MINLLVQSFKDGLHIVKSLVILFVPIALFLAIERYTETFGAEAKPIGFGDNIIEFLGANISQPIITVLIVILLVKSIFIFLSNVIILPAYFEDRSISFSAQKIVAGVGYYAMFTIVWYVVFLFIGLSIGTIFYNLIGVSIYANLVIASFFLLLFPCFYTGLSVFPFISIANIANLPMNKISWKMAKNLYWFFSLRSVIDLIFMIGIPVIVAYLELAPLAGVTIVFFTTVVFVTYMRSVAVAFKAKAIIVRKC